MKYLLDTNACVDYLNGRFSTKRIQQSAPSDLAISSVAFAELRYGAEKSTQRHRNHERLDVFLGDVPCVDFDSGAALVYGRVRAVLERRGTAIGPTTSRSRRMRCPWTSCWSATTCASSGGLKA